MQTGFGQFVRAGCLSLLVLVPCSKALESCSDVMALHWHNILFGDGPGSIIMEPGFRDFRVDRIIAVIRNNRQISWYRFLLWLGLIEALPQEEPGGAYRLGGVSTTATVASGILTAPVTRRPKYRYSPRSRATALKAKRPYPWHLHHYRYQEHSSGQQGKPGQEAPVPAKKKKNKQGLESQAGRTAQMQKLKERVGQNQGDWDLVKNFEKELTDSKQLILANALLYFGNALEKINQKVNYPVPETAADFEQQLALVDPFLLAYTFSLVHMFSNFSLESERPEIRRWQHSAEYLMHFVMVDYNWPVELLEQWIDQTGPSLAFGTVHLNLPAASYPQWTSAFCQSQGGNSLALQEKELDKDDRYSFLPSMIASLEFRRFIDAFTQYHPDVLEQESRHGDMMMIRSFQVLLLLLLDSSGTMNPHEQQFIHAWLRLREIDGGIYTGWNTLFGLIEQDGAVQPPGVPAGLVPVETPEPDEFYPRRPGN